MDGVKKSVVLSDEWTLTQGRFEIGTARAYEGLFALGSGYLQTRGSVEEHFTDSEQNSRRLRRPANVTSEKFEVTPSKWGTYVPGVFGEHPLLLHEMINLPWFLELAPVMEGERLDLRQSQHTEFRCTLNMKTASLVRTLTWQLSSGNRVRLCFERFISDQRSGLSVQRLTFISEKLAEVALNAGIVADVTTNGFNHFTEVTVAPSGQDGIFCEVMTDGNDISKSKPDPEVFLLAATRLGLLPEECVVVEDAEAGVEAARRAGMGVFAIGPEDRFPGVADHALRHGRTVDG